MPIDKEMLEELVKKKKKKKKKVSRWRRIFKTAEKPVDCPFDELVGSADIKSWGKKRRPGVNIHFATKRF